MIREFAHAYAKADRAADLLDLGITEHHNAVDNVLSPINLGLLWDTSAVRAPVSAGSEQRAGWRRHGGDPQQAAGVPGHREGPEACARYEEVCGVAVIPSTGGTRRRCSTAMERGADALYVIGENPAILGADVGRARKLKGTSTR